MKQSFVLLAFAAAAVCLGAAGCDKSKERNGANSSKAASGAVKLRDVQKQFLTVEEVGASGKDDTLALPGRITFRPQAQFAVGAPIAGRVSAVLVRAGEAVKTGAPLLHIDSADAAAARAALEQAKTRLVSAENLYKRQVEMVERGVGLEFERQEADARLKEARAEHERALQSVSLIGAGQGSRYAVRAPANGVVMAIRAAVGATVAPGGEPLLELGDPTQLLVVAQVAESDLHRVTQGLEAEVELPALSARLPARLESFSPRVDPESRRAQLYLTLAGRAEGVRAGMLAQVALRVAAVDGISVPVTAVLIKEGKRRVVYVEDADGAFRAREVQTGRNRDGRVVILQGLKAGERVVVRGALLLDTQAEQLL
jgi:cobalt-zinc-cadmium efflux system membrane fusion protein